MIIFFNAFGGLLLTSGYLLPFGIGLLFQPLDGLLFWTVFGSILFVGDMLIRVFIGRRILALEPPPTGYQPEPTPHWLISKHGGMIMFLPAWVVGILWPLFIAWVDHK